MNLNIYEEYSNNIIKANKELENVINRFSKLKKKPAQYDLRAIISNCKVIETDEVMPVRNIHPMCLFCRLFLLSVFFVDMFLVRKKLCAFL